jgi:cell division control protein 6
MLISRTRNFLHLLDESTISTLSPVTIELKPYNQEQLYKIISDRIDQSFKVGTIPTDTIHLASDIAGERGDARYALELMWFAGKYADQSGNSTVYPDYVRQAKSNLEPSLSKDVLKQLSVHELLVCLAIASQLRISNSAYITTGLAENSYQMICEQNSMEPRKHTQFWEFIKQLDHLNIIHSELSGKGQRGRTQNITLQDVSASNLEEEVKTQLKEFQTE